ncbi:unnamed protein product [Oppiella nova]|uniref:Uncharacterized protein n=1 Tax=Oppiella nova TaxID=334625 RepID=A0A7R9MTH3_9ACAR|nr:unnamed protein product [Oppiella nova]CAG2183326.1 unnamed protein product [Oppiella nova]
MTSDGSRLSTNTSMARELTFKRQAFSISSIPWCSRCCRTRPESSYTSRRHTSGSGGYYRHPSFRRRSRSWSTMVSWNL